MYLNLSLSLYVVILGEHRNVVAAECRLLLLNCQHPHRRYPRGTCEYKPTSLALAVAPALSLVLPR